MFVVEQRNGPTNIKIMKIVKSEKQNIDITVDNVTYMPDVVNEGKIVNFAKFNLLKGNLSSDDIVYF